MVRGAGRCVVRGKVPLFLHRVDHRQLGWAGLGWAGWAGLSGLGWLGWASWVGLGWDKLLLPDYRLQPAL